MEENQNQQKNYALPLSIVIAAVFISGSILYVNGNNENVTKVTAPKLSEAQLALLGAVKTTNAEGRDVVIGDPKAPITMIEYADYQCPYCGRFYKQTLGKIIENYVKTGKVKLVHRNFAFLGPESMEAAKAAECAKDQSKFWPYQFSLYEEEQRDGREHNGNLNRDLFLSIAKNLKMNANDFAACLDEGTYGSFVEQETERARKEGINSTPTFVVNGEKILGAFPYEDFQDTDGSTREGFDSILKRTIADRTKTK